MMKGVRAASVAGALLGGLFSTGCLADQSGLVKGLAADLEEPPLPRVSRLQQIEQLALAQTDQVTLPQLPAEDPDLAPLQNAEMSHVAVRAWVNGKPIFEDEVLGLVLPVIQTAAFSPDERAAKQAELYNEVLDSLIEREIVYQDALKTLEKFSPKGLEELQKAAGEIFQKQMRQARERSKLTEVEFRNELARQGMSLRNLRRKIEHEFIGREYVRSRILPRLDSEIGHREIRNYYMHHQNEFQRLDLVEWQNVFIGVTPQRPTLDAARRFAEELIDRAKKGEDFASFIKYDDGDSHIRNGLGFGQRRGEIQPPEVEKYLFEMKEGEVGPPVELSTGVHIFRVVRREYAGQIGFTEEVQRTIRNKLRQDMADREYKAFVRELRARAIIEIESR